MGSEMCIRDRILSFMVRNKATASLTGTGGANSQYRTRLLHTVTVPLALHYDVKATGLPNATLNVEIAYIIYNKEFKKIKIVFTHKIKENTNTSKIVYSGYKPLIIISTIANNTR